MLSTSQLTSPRASRGDPSNEHGSVRLPLLGLCIPAPIASRAVYYGAIAGLVAVDLVDWPVALMVVVGHEILKRSHGPVGRGVGEAAETI